MLSLLRHLSWPEWRHHPWRQLAALLAIVLGVALAFSVHLINQSALGEFSAAVRSINGQPDFELRGQRGGFDEALYGRVARHPDIALASPVIEVETQAITADAPEGAKRVPLRVLGIDALVAAPMSPALWPELSKAKSVDANASGAARSDRAGDDKPDRLGLFDPRALQFHELVAGALLGLALALYRPERWWPSLLAAALALAIRELALPFLLLWAAFAASERRWRQVLALALVIALFALGMVFHAQAVIAQVLPTDPLSPPWAGFNGPQLALLSLARLTPLLLLPEAVAAPIALLALLGWIGLGGRLGLFATLWFAGMGLAMALFARTNNFYWVLVLLPAYAAGLAFVPRALAELVRSAIGRQKSHS